MDASYIVQGEFFVGVMMEYMTVHQLLEFRQISSKLYGHITMDKIKELVIEKAQDYIKEVTGKKYDDFITILGKYKATISGMWTTMLIYGEESNMRIEIGWWFNGLKNDLSQIGEVNTEFDGTGDYLSMFDGKIMITQNYVPDVEIFQNYIRIRQNVWEFTINYINKVVNRRERVNLAFDNSLLISQNQKCNIGMDIQKVTSCIFPKYVLGFYDEENIMLLGKCIKRTDSPMKIEVLGRNDCSYFDIDINGDCASTDCILNICSYDHLHSKLSCNGVYLSAILVKYTLDHDIFDDLKADIVVNNYRVTDLPFWYDSIECDVEGGGEDV